MGINIVFGRENRRYSDAHSYEYPNSQKFLVSLEWKYILVNTGTSS